jgi:adenosylcobinamide-phosphate synthase
VLTGLVTLTAVLWDTWFGWPARWHPLNAVRRLALGLLPRQAGGGRGRGALALLLLMSVSAGPFVLVPLLLPAGPARFLVELGVLALSLGGHRLRHRALAVEDALLDDDLEAARVRLADLTGQVRHDPPAGRGELATQALGTVLGRSCDVLFGPLLWYWLLGLPGAVACRVLGIAAESWAGEPAFGWAAARLDRWAGWLPARLTALTYRLQGLPKGAIHLPGGDGRGRAGGRAMGVTLGGEGLAGATETDIGRAVDLVLLGAWIWVVAAALGGFVAWGLP